MNLIIVVFQAWILVMAIGIDAFVCSFGYGTNKIRIPFRSAMVINLVCTALLGVGLIFGTAIGSLLPESMADWIAFTILFLLGISKIFDSAIKGVIRRHNGINKEVKFSLLSLGFMLKVYADPKKADIDDSKELIPREATPLSIALGLDGLSVGFGVGVGMTAIGALLILGLSLITGILLVLLGCFLGNRIVQRTALDLSWLSGAILIGIAIAGILW